MGKKSRSGIRIRDEQPGSFSKSFFRVEDLNSFMRPKFFDKDPDPGSGTFLTPDPGPAMEKIQIRDKHPGSATLLKRP
jgi:hypothetical protein